MSRLSDSIAALRNNEKQWRAFTTAGHCVVLAPPGSGKTKLLTTRLAYDLFNTIPEPHGAACITLTNAAADELRRRLDILGTPPRSTLFVGTVHSFALRRVIAPYAALVGKEALAMASVASTQEQTAAYGRAISEVFTTAQEARLARSTIEMHRRRLSDAEDWEKSGSRIVEAGRLYEEILTEAGLIDFDGIVAAAVDLVESHSVIRQVLTARYPNFYVDEYQDLPPGLDRLVRALCFDYGTSAQLFAVGDPDQAVFGWMGSRPELLHELAGRGDITPVHLNHNYRCGAEIIRVANLVRKEGLPVTGDRLGGSVSAVYRPGGLRDQYAGAAGIAQRAIERGVKTHEIVAICPTNEICRSAADVFRKTGVPAFVRGVEYRLSQTTLFVEACAAWTTLGRELSSYRLAELIRRWRRLLGSWWTRVLDVELTELLISYSGRGEEAASAFLAALHDLGLHRAIEGPSNADEASEFGQMREAMTTGSLTSLTVRGLAERARRVDRIEVTTMTSSKGLEFDVVLILGMDDKLIPHIGSLDDPVRLAEDRRKFYVSVTRARDEVHIFYSGYVEWKSGKRSQAGPSRFLKEIGLV